MSRLTNPSLKSTFRFYRLGCSLFRFKHTLKQHAWYDIYRLPKLDEFVLTLKHIVLADSIKDALCRPYPNGEAGPPRGAQAPPPPAASSSERPPARAGLPPTPVLNSVPSTGRIRYLSSHVGTEEIDGLLSACVHARSSLKSVALDSLKIGSLTKFVT